MTDESRPSAAEPSNDQASSGGNVHGSAETMNEASESAEAETAGPTGNDELRQQAEEANARALRAQAELENFRKRARRENDEALRYATMPLLQDLLSVVDNLELALQSAEQHQDASGLLEGVKMVSSQLTEALKRHGCTEIEAAGQAFDPHRHEALVAEPSETVPANMVTRVYRSGYMLHDRVIRPAQVYVSSGPPVSPTE